MSKKRFVISLYTDKIHDKEKGEQYYFEDMEDWIKICVLLNEQHEEIEKLKKVENNCDNCKHSKAIHSDVECRKKGFIAWQLLCEDFEEELE